jgi:hypothetical protein
MQLLVKEKVSVVKGFTRKKVWPNKIRSIWPVGLAHIMEPPYERLRRQIYTTEAEFKRFCQSVVNSAMVAKDIIDKGFKETTK